jgi:hypothetical protein
MDETPKYAVSINFKKNLGNYESVDIYVGVSSVTAENIDLIEEEGGRMVERIYAHLKDRLSETMSDAVQEAKSSRQQGARAL